MNRSVLPALLLVFTSIFTQAQTPQLDSLKQLLKTTKNDTLYCQVLGQLADNEPDENIWPTYNKKLLNFSKGKLSTSNGVVKQTLLRYYAFAVGNEGYIARFKGDLRLADSLYHEALILYGTCGHKIGEGSMYTNLGVLYQSQGNNLLAVDYFNKAIAAHESIGDNLGAAKPLMNAGFVYNEQGDVLKALACYQKALKTFRQLGDKNGEADCLANLGSVCQAQKDFEKATDYYTQARVIYEEVKNRRGIAESWQNIGSVYNKKMERDNALDCYNKAQEIYGEIGYKRGVASILNNKGSVLKGSGKLDEAIETFSKSLEIWKELNFKRGMAVTQDNIALTYIEKKNYGKALEFALKGMQTAREMGAPAAISESAKTLEEIYTAQHNPAKALEMYKLFILMRDSTNTSNIRKETLKKQFQVEYEKKSIKDSIATSAREKEEQLKHENAIARQRTFTYGGLLGFILMLVIAVISYRAFKNKKKANIIIHEQKELAEHQKHIIEEKQKEILDSINYAKRIQTTLMAHDEFLKKELPNHFVFFKPKDIVSGDFYWATTIVKNGPKTVKENSLNNFESLSNVEQSSNETELFYLAVCDSTGHGVPGAFMSLLNISFLNEAINEKNIHRPNEVLGFVRQRLIDNISREGQRDGFDGILLCIEKWSGGVKVTYAAANNAPVIVRGNEIIDLACDKMPVGKGEREEPFSLFTVNMQPGDVIFLYTDGYADQFGGPKGKKFKYKPLDELLKNNAGLPMSQQRDELLNQFNHWKGELEQVDDVCIIGLSV